MSRRSDRAAARRQADALAERVLGSRQPRPEPDIDAQFREALRREVEREAEERRQVEERKYQGGPCCSCGTGDPRQVDTNDPTPRPDWHTHSRGPECGGCRDLRGTDTDETFLDLIAGTLAAYGVDALANPNWKRFKIERGAAERWGVKFWVDSGEPPGERFDHLRPVAEAIVEDRQRRMAEPSVGWDEAITRLPSSPPSPTYGRDEVAWQRLLDGQRTGVRRTVSDAEVDRRIARERKRIERTGRRR